MKVRVSYAADIDEIPRLVNNLLNTMSEDLRGAANNLTFNPNNFEQMARDLFAVRESLSLIDSRIEDVVNLTRGWIDATSPQVEPELDLEDSLDNQEPSND